MASPIGRNEPCPCGSGKKYKRCCGAEADSVVQLPDAPRGEPVSGWARAHTLWPKTGKALGEHALAWLGEKRLFESLHDCWLFDPEEGLDPDWMPIFQSWQFYDWVADGENQSIAQHFLQRHSVVHQTGDADLLRMIESAQANPLTLYQVQSIDRGRGVVVRDLLTHEQRFVVDRSISEGVPPWSVFMARLINLESFTMFDAVAPRVLQSDWAKHLTRWMEENLEATIPFSRDFLREYGDVVMECYYDAVAEDDEERRKMPILQNTDDESLVLCEERWSFAATLRHAIIERLVDIGFACESDGKAGPLELRWVRDERDRSPLSTTLAILRVEATEIRLETNSRERRDRFKAQIESVLLRELTHIDSKERNPQEMRTTSPESNVPRREIPPEVAQQAIREHLSQHYSTWPDCPIPALGGKSPRDAMKTVDGRASVENLIRDMEHRSHGTPLEKEYDFDQLRHALGLLETAPRSSQR